VFDGLIQRLSPRFRVLAVDLLGCGNSDPLPPGITMERIAGTLVDMLDGLGIARAHYYGFQTGNKIGTALAVNRPDRVGRIVLAGSSHSLVPDKARRDAAILHVVAHYFEGDAAAGEAAKRLQLWATGFRRISDLWWDGALFAAGPPGAEALERARNAVIDRVQGLNSVVGTYEANFAYDLGAELRRIRTRTLLIEVATPTEDKTVGRQGPGLLAIMPPGTELLTFQEPDAPSHGIALANRYPELAEVLTRFLLD
jgi:pimeloyl-ACP methyl ester carboxylesterase